MNEYWIHVTEWLPKVSGYYLVCVHPIERPMVALFTAAGDWLLDNSLFTDAVTHWMALPEMPKDEVD